MEPPHTATPDKSITGRIKGHLRKHPMLWTALYLGIGFMAFPVPFAVILLVEHVAGEQWAVENPLKVMAIFLPFAALLLVSLIALRYLIWPKTLGGPSFGQSTLEGYARHHNVPDTNMKTFLRVFTMLLIIICVVLWLI